LLQFHLLIFVLLVLLVIVLALLVLLTLLVIVLALALDRQFLLVSPSANAPLTPSLHQPKAHK
jgi:hypothetical protein